MEFTETFSVSLLLVLTTFVWSFRDRLNIALILVAILIALALTSLLGSCPPSTLNPIQLMGTILWNGVLKTMEAAKS